MAEWAEVHPIDHHDLLLDQYVRDHILSQSTAAGITAEGTAQHGNRSTFRTKLKKNVLGRYMCEFCDKSYKQISDVFKHQRRVHARESEKAHPIEQRSVPCHLCGKLLQSRKRMLTHVRRIHMGRSSPPKPYHRGSLLKTNSAGKYVCEFCNRSFSQAQSVYAHQRKVHGRESEKVERRTGRGKFLCSVCGKRLAYHGDLLRHLRVNHGVGTDPS